MSIELCYIFLSAGLKSDSVQNKVISQIKGLNHSGVKCRGFFFTNDVEVVTKFDDHIILIPYPITNKQYFNIIFQKKALIKHVTSYVSENLNRNELIYLRYPGASYELFKLSKKFKNRIISEHQSKETAEILSLRSEHPISFNISRLISYFLYQIWPIYNEILWSKYYSKMLLAKVAVTNEIASYHSRFCKNVWVVPNGISVAKYKLRTSPILGDKLRIIFLKGTSGNAPWNGLDRLISSIDDFSNKENIELIICGSIIEGEIPYRHYIKLTGYMNSEELDSLISNVHLGFSTLCLFRKNLEEAAVLKAREYYARGLPFVYGYIDPDLEKIEVAKNYSYKVENNESKLNFDLILNFIKNVYKDSNHPSIMRNIAIENLDWNIKMNHIKENITKLKS